MTNSAFYQQARINGNSDGMYHMKILIPCITAGAIIGKGGETIAQLQTETNTKIKMSKTNDFYPGTTERVCIISGSSSEHIMAALTFIMERIREKPDASNRVQNSGDAIADREKQVKILIPNSTAGMIIGKAGAYIKQLKEDSGCFVQISQKAKDTTLQERCITVSGNTEGNKKVCSCILNKIIEDPLSASCPNLSYADVNGPVANFNPTGSPYALAPTNCSNNQTSYNLNATSLSTQDVSNGIFTNKFLDNVKPLLRSSGYPESAVNEIAVAFLTLAKHNVLSPNSIIGLINQTSILQPAPSVAHHNGTGLLSTVTNDLFDLGLAGGAISINAILSQNAASPTLSNANSYGLGVAAAAAAAAAAASTPKAMGPTTNAAAAAAAGRRGRPVRDDRRRPAIRQAGDGRARVDRGRHHRPRRPVAGRDPADERRHHPHIQEGRVRAGHHQPEGDDMRVGQRHSDGQLPHAAEDRRRGDQAGPRVLSPSCSITYYIIV
ncbi:unnamed protein product [Macrosiphum euphorbiae]|uniref:K Homology domain-containing protein n=1 Tax=Macrosiphum euphorbiae TaxID=13131 RepID=A0AAV0VPW6_9HEMI|nr:unnamed protein product [Macrosiphum euphorbiae]